MTNLTSNRSWGRWVRSNHYYSLNADDQSDFQQKLGSMGGKWSLLFSERRWPTWLPTEAGVDGWEVIINILWTPMTNMTSNRNWGRWVGSDHYYFLNVDDQPDFQQKLGRWVGSDHYYSLNADDQHDFQQKLGSIGRKWSLLFSERRWPTWLPAEAGSIGRKWSLLFSERRWPTWLSTEAGVDGWEVIITILWTPMTNMTFDRSRGRCVGSDHYYSLNADDQHDVRQKLGSMYGNWSLLFPERRWSTCHPTEAGVDGWEVIITILWSSKTNLTSNRSLLSGNQGRKSANPCTRKV